MDKRPCIDIHAHYYPETFLELIAADGAEFGATVSTSNPKGPVIDVGLLHAGPLARKFIDLDERVAEQVVKLGRDAAGQEHTLAR